MQSKGKLIRFNENILLFLSDISKFTEIPESQRRNCQTVLVITPIAQQLMMSYLKGIN